MFRTLGLAEPVKVLSRVCVCVAILAVSSVTPLPAHAATSSPVTTSPCPIAPTPSNFHAPPPPPQHVRVARPNSDNALTQPGMTTPNGTPPIPTELSAHSWVIADLDTGDVVAACDPHARYAPASVIKLLTALTVAPRVKASTAVTVTPEDLNYEPGSSAVGLVQGGRYTVRELLLGLFLNSGNDAANVLARIGGGKDGLPGALVEMNKLAHRIGAFDTVALNPHGLDAENQLTSTFDLALIAREAFKRQDLAGYMATQIATIPAQPGYDGFLIYNDNRLLHEYPGALGGKTGFTDNAQHSYVGAASRNGRRLVVTMLYGQRYPVPLWQQAASLLDWGFSVPLGTNIGKLTTKPANRVRDNEASATSSSQRSMSFGLLSLGLVALGITAASLLWLRHRQSAKVSPQAEGFVAD